MHMWSLENVLRELVTNKIQKLGSRHHRMQNEGKSATSKGYTYWTLLIALFALVHSLHRLAPLSAGATTSHACRGYVWEYLAK